MNHVAHGGSTVALFPLPARPVSELPVAMLVGDRSTPRGDPWTHTVLILLLFNLLTVPVLDWII